MTDQTEAPERIWAHHNREDDPGHPFEGWWHIDDGAAGLGMHAGGYTRADVAQAMVAAALEEAAGLCAVLQRFPQLREIGSTIHDDLAEDIRALITPEQSAALDRVKAEARERCARIADDYPEPHGKRIAAAIRAEAEREKG